MASSTHSYRPPGRRRGERLLALVALICAGAVPGYLYRELLSQVLGNFAFDVDYIAFGASGFTLMALGLLVGLPVVFSIGRNPDSRLYPRSRAALAGWSVSLYLLGITLVIQIGAIAANW